MISSFSFYCDVYHGTLLTEEEFPRYCVIADSYLDSLTLGRYLSTDLSDYVLNAVRLAECAAADLCCERETASAENPSVVRETVGDHSVTYRTSEDSASGWSTRIRDSISRYLVNTGLLCRAIPHRFTV